MAGPSGGVSQASLNASIPEQPRQRGNAPGGAGRPAQQGAGIESGLAMRERFATSNGADILGKHIPQSGTPPWEGPIEHTGEGHSVEDTFGAGEKHTIKNG